MTRSSPLVIHSFVFIALATVSFCLGALLNLARKAPLSWHYETPAQRLIGGHSEQLSGNRPSIRRSIQIISLDELLELQAKNRAVVFDVRPHLFFQLGHIPNSHSLPLKDFEAYYKKNERRMQEAMERGKEIVLYCSGAHCPDASKTATKLLGMKYGNLSVFEPGWEAWQKEGLKVKSSM